MSQCIEKLPHTCGSRKGLQTFANEETGKVDGFCFSCGVYVPNPYGEPIDVKELDLTPPPTEEEIQETLEEVALYPVVDVPSRKLRAGALDKFNIKTSLSETDGTTPTAFYLPVHKDGQLSGYYVKTIGKDSKVWAIGSVKSPDPFGWNEAKKSGAYRLIITEGALDAVSVATIYEKEGKPDWQPAVISLPNGTQSVKSLHKIAQEVSRMFKEIVLCFDNDAAGQKAVSEAMLVFPKALNVLLPCKDANECLVEGRRKASYKSLAFNASSPKNTRLVSGNELHAVARKPTEYGQLTWPFPSMNKLLRNIRYGETIYIGAGVKMGKSELLNQIAGHIIKEHEVPVFMAKPEENNVKTYKLMCNKMVGSVFHDPEVEFDEDLFDKAGGMLEDKLFMVNLYQHLGWETLKADIISAANAGCKAIFVDPITNLTNGVPSGEANVKLQEIAQELASLALDLNIVIFIFCHLRAHEGTISKEYRAKKYQEDKYVGLGNCSHEFGGDVMSYQFAGSRAMMRSCNLMLGLEGNKDPQLDEEVRNMRWITILEDREFGNSARVPIYWNPHTTLYKEM